MRLRLDSKQLTFEMLEAKALLTCSSAPPGIISCWNGDGTAEDSVANNDGVLVGDATYVSGQVNLAFSLDGNGDYVEIADSPDSSLDGMTEITVAAWILRTSDGGPTYSHIFTKYNTVPQGRINNELSIYVAMSPSGEVRFVFYDDTFDVTQDEWNRVGGETVSADVPLNTWTHVAGTWDGSSFHIYVNGIDQSFTDLSAGSFSRVRDTDEPVRIGAVSSGSTGGIGAFFPGAIDEAMIFDRGLSPEEIQEIVELCQTKSVDIDIKPGSFPNSINLGSNGNVPVAILSTAGFDATNVDPATVALSDASVKVRGNGTPQAAEEDVNGDGLLDLVVHLHTEGLALTEGDASAVLEGLTFSGQPIRGSDFVRVIQSLHVAGGPGESVVVANELLTHIALDPLLERAISHWATAGVDSHQMNRLKQVDMQIADLVGSLLGAASANTIWIDQDAAGYGWRVDAGGVDLLSVLTHELGHVLGFDHDTMGLDDTLDVGARSLPQLVPLAGDANRNGVFDRFDLIAVLQTGKYLSDEPATWNEGDWTGDGEFDQWDIVAALQMGNYLASVEAGEVFARRVD